jgi:hypothetical protein
VTYIINFDDSISIEISMEVLPEINSIAVTATTEAYKDDNIKSLAFYE